MSLMKIWLWGDGENSVNCTMTNTCACMHTHTRTTPFTCGSSPANEESLTFLHARHTSIYGKITSQDGESAWGQQKLNIKGWFWSTVVPPFHRPWMVCVPLPEKFLRHTTRKSTFSLAISNWTLKVSSLLYISCAVSNNKCQHRDNSVDKRTRKRFGFLSSSIISAELMK